MEISYTHRAIALYVSDYDNDLNKLNSLNKLNLEHRTWVEKNKKYIENALNYTNIKYVQIVSSCSMPEIPCYERFRKSIGYLDDDSMRYSILIIFEPQHIVSEKAIYNFYGILGNKFQRYKQDQYMPIEQYINYSAVVEYIFTNLSGRNIIDTIGEPTMNTMNTTNTMNTMNNTDLILHSPWINYIGISMYIGKPHIDHNDIYLIATKLNQCGIKTAGLLTYYNPNVKDVNEIIHVYRGMNTLPFRESILILLKPITESEITTELIDDINAKIECQFNSYCQADGTNCNIAMVSYSYIGNNNRLYSEDLTPRIHKINAEIKAEIDAANIKQEQYDELMARGKRDSEFVNSIGYTVPEVSHISRFPIYSQSKNRKNRKYYNPAYFYERNNNTYNSSMNIKELKAVIEEKGLTSKTVGFTEKSEYVDLLNEHIYDPNRKAEEAHAARKAKEAEDPRKAKEAEDARKAKEAEDARKTKEIFNHSGIFKSNLLDWNPIADITEKQKKASAGGKKKVGKSKNGGKSKKVGKSKNGRKNKKTRKNK